MSSMNTELPNEGTYRFQTPNGSYRSFMARALPVKNSDGHVIRLSGVSTDVEDLVRAETAARDNEEWFTLALDATSDGMWGWNRSADGVSRGFTPERSGFVDSQFGGFVAVRDYGLVVGLRTVPQ
jgi:PAS domain-containing protein